MKKSLLFLMSFLMFSVFAFGQRKLTAEEKLSKDMDVMTKALSLTTEQVALINPMLREAQVKQTALLRDMCCDSSGSLYQNKDFADASKKIITDLDLQIGAVISKTQLIKLQSYRETQKKANTF
jgi:hypothetical protein